MVKRRRKKLRKRDYFIIASIAGVVTYTIAAIIVQIITSTELSPTLTEWIFKFFTMEIFTIGGVTLGKTAKGTDGSPVAKDNVDSSNRKG